MFPLSRLWIAAALACAACVGAAQADDLQPLPYNNPGLVVDLGVGLWANPLPMDYDGDGDPDLLVSTANKATPGIYFFENPGGGGPMPIFKPGRRVSDAHGNVTIAHGPGGPRVFTPGAEHPQFKLNGLASPAPIKFKPDFHRGRDDQWTIFDFDADGADDLIVGASDWREYGWDDAFDSQGNWTRGPLHAFVYIMRNTGTNAAPNYEAPFRLRAGEAELDVYGSPSPNFADFDADGDLDLVCGEFLDKLTYFENVGSRAAPRYAEGRRLLSGGRPVTFELQMLRVASMDWDSDGDADLIVGEEDGRVAYLEHTGKLEADRTPSFEPRGHFKQQAGALKCGALANPSSVDFDADGDADLICGDTAGFISFIENLGGGANPKWASPRRLEAGGETIRIQAGPNGSIQGPAEAKWGYTAPVAADWDHDGLPDIVINSIWGKIVWYRNVGSPKAPKLAAAAPIEVEWPGAPPKPAWNWWSPEGKQLVTQWRTTPCAVDLNRDGLLDLVMLDTEGYLGFFERQKRDGRLVLLPPQRIFKDEAGAPLRMNEGRAGKSGRRTFCFADWDGDGRLDLMANSKNIDFMRNVGAAGEFQFKNLGPVAERTLAGHSTCPTVVDWNADAKPDLLIGAEDGFFYLRLNPGS